MICFVTGLTLSAQRKTVIHLTSSHKTHADLICKALRHFNYGCKWDTTVENVMTVTFSTVFHQTVGFQAFLHEPLLQRLCTSELLKWADHLLQQWVVGKDEGGNTDCKKFERSSWVWKVRSMLKCLHYFWNQQSHRPLVSNRSPIACKLLRKWPYFSLNLLHL